MGNARMRWLIAVVLASISVKATADVKLPVLIHDHMVIQRGAKFTAWGWAKPGEKVSVAMGENKAEAVTGENGMWNCQLAAMEANDKPVEMTVAGTNTITVKDILVGDVWFCAGQSNMALALKVCDNGAEEVAKATQPTIRLFLAGAAGPRPLREDLNSLGWSVCDPAHAASFSGVAYYFGRKLNEELKVPIGLIEAGYGGTANEQWMPAEAFNTDKTLADYPAKFAALEAAYPKLKEEYDKKKAEFDTALAKVNATQPGVKAGQSGFGLPPSPVAPRQPSVMVGKLYESSVVPLRRVALSGIIWYQGENNVGEHGVFAAVSGAGEALAGESWAGGFAVSLRRDRR